VKPPVSVVLPPAVVTTTSAAPAVPDGVVMAIEVAVSVTTVAGLPPTVTVAANRFVPPMVTLVPPAVGPEEGVTEVTIGPGGR